MKLCPYFLHFSPGLDKIQYNVEHLLSESFVKIRTMKEQCRHTRRMLPHNHNKSMTF